jgi:hypothetical protein
VPASFRNQKKKTCKARWLRIPKAVSCSPLDWNFTFLARANTKVSSERFFLAKCFNVVASSVAYLRKKETSTLIFF